MHCINYCALNNTMVKYKDSLPLISVLLDLVCYARPLLKLVLHPALNVIQIKEGDEQQTAFQTPHSQFKYRVIQLGLDTALATFLGEWMIAYGHRCMSSLNTVLKTYLPIRLIRGSMNSMCAKSYWDSRNVDCIAKLRIVNSELRKLASWGLYSLQMESPGNCTGYPQSGTCQQRNQFNWSSCFSDLKTSTKASYGYMPRWLFHRHNYCRNRRDLAASNQKPLPDGNGHQKPSWHSDI